MADTSKTEEPTKVPESTDAGAGATAGAGAGAGAGAPAEGAKKKHHGDAEIEDESRVTETPALPKNGKKGPRTVKRRGVARKKKFGKVTLIEYSDCNVAGAPIIDGFPAVTVTATIAAGFLADQLKLPVVAELTSPDFPSVCLIDSGRPTNAMRIVGNSDLVILLSEFEVADPELTQDIVDAIFDFALVHECGNLFTVEGIPKGVLARVLEKKKKEEEGKSDDEEEEEALADITITGPGIPPKKVEDPTDKMSKKEVEELMATLMYLTTDESTASTLHDMGHIAIDNAVINGTTGRFLSNINTTTVEVTCLLAATHSELPDALSAVTIVKCLDKLLPHVAFDLGPLEKKAASLEKSVAELRSMLEAQTRREAPQGLYS